MELLLNLVWLLLAVPAFWLWRRGVSTSGRKYGSLHCLLALACILVLLFPVISATDDLHAMRAEAEEQGVSKRTVRQAVADKCSAATGRWHAAPAVIAAVFSALPASETRLILYSTPSSNPETAPVHSPSRAPPRLHLA